MGLARPVLWLLCAGLFVAACGASSSNSTLLLAVTPVSDGALGLPILAAIPPLCTSIPPLLHRAPICKVQPRK